MSDGIVERIGEDWRGVEKRREKSKSEMLEKEGYKWRIVRQESDKEHVRKMKKEYEPNLPDHDVLLSQKLECLPGSPLALLLLQLCPAKSPLLR